MELPKDLLGLILGSVSQFKTIDDLRKTSRTFRIVCSDPVYRPELQKAWCRSLLNDCKQYALLVYQSQGQDSVHILNTELESLSKDLQLGFHIRHMSASAARLICEVISRALYDAAPARPPTCPEPFGVISPSGLSQAEYQSKLEQRMQLYSSPAIDCLSVYASVPYQTAPEISCFLSRAIGLEFASANATQPAIAEADEQPFFLHQHHHGLEQHWHWGLDTFGASFSSDTTAVLAACSARQPGFLRFLLGSPNIRASLLQKSCEDATRTVCRSGDLSSLQVLLEKLPYIYLIPELVELLANRGTIQLKQQLFERAMEEDMEEAVATLARDRAIVVPELLVKLYTTDWQHTRSERRRAILSTLEKTAAAAGFLGAAQAQALGVILQNSIINMDLLKRLLHSADDLSMVRLSATPGDLHMPLVQLCGNPEHVDMACKLLDCPDVMLNVQKHLKHWDAAEQDSDPCDLKRSAKILSAALNSRHGGTLCALLLQYGCHSITSMESMHSADKHLLLLELASAGHVAHVRAVLQQGVSPAAQECRALIAASRAGHAEVVQELCSQASMKLGVYGTIALRVAVEQGHEKVVKVLLAHGACMSQSAVLRALEMARDRDCASVNAIAEILFEVLC